jgi:hypothetical protein
MNTITITDARQYDDIIRLMDELSDDGAGRQAHPLHELFLMAGDLAYEYESRTWSPGLLRAG